ncbi:hypothetical protein AAON49_08480 [Pseudotenacibaculum sp. MALMAid0570]|uniref:hypothetical protein n=1 Tax=Pseudotenacibaculum sp. MALMAid0570 TaxID=3143938 RepID=UPI0032DE82A1
MKTHKNKSIENNNTLDILDEIQEVKVSPFFKNKVLNTIRQQKEEKTPSFGWFTPQLQLATLALVLCINVLTIYFTFNSQETSQEISGFEAFMEDYYLDSDNTLTLN